MGAGERLEKQIQVFQSKAKNETVWAAMLVGMGDAFLAQSKVSWWILWVRFLTRNLCMAFVRKPRRQLLVLVIKGRSMSQDARKLRSKKTCNPSKALAPSTPSTPWLFRTRVVLPPQR